MHNMHNRIFLHLFTFDRIFKTWNLGPKSVLTFNYRWENLAIVIENNRSVSKWLAYSSCLEKHPLRAPGRLEPMVAVVP